MQTLKGVVFPIVRIVLWAAIAVALVWLAFFSGGVSADDDGRSPGASFDTPRYTVGFGDIVNNVDVTATVVADPVSNIQSTVDGYVGAWLVDDGQWVEAGTVVVEVRREVPATVDANGLPVPATFTRHNLTSPIPGTVKRSLLLNQPTSIGSTVAAVNPGTLSVSGSLTPEQLFRLETVPAEAEVSITSGPAPFTCSGLMVGSPSSATPDPNDPGGEGGGSTTVSASCPVPEGVRLFAGMSGTMSLAAREVHGVITVPVTAVQGSYDVGRVWVVDAFSGEETERDITLGLSDGANIEVKEGLADGEVILQFAPGNMQPLPGGPGMPVDGGMVVEDSVEFAR